MNTVVKRIQIDLYSPTSYEVIKAQQGDSLSRIVEIALLNKGEPYVIPTHNVSIRLEGHRGDGSSFSKGSNCTLKDNIITVVLDNDILFYSGTVEAKVVLYELPDDGTKRILSSIPFRAHVQKNPCDKNNVTMGNKSLIDDLIFDFTNLEVAVNKTITDEIDRATKAEKDLDAKKVDKTTIATSSTLGLVKSGTDIIVDSSGNVSVNDNSHKHTVSNISDLTVTANELNVLDGITSTTAELNKLHDTTATVDDFNKLHGVTASASELNIMDGVTATTTELNYVDGVTSNIQTQLNAKAPLASPTLTGTPKAPTASAGTNTTQIATTAFVQTAVSNLVNSAPETLDTLGEIADALKDNADIVDVLNESIATKANASDLTSHTSNTTAHITATERTNWNDANSKKHTHSNKSILDNTTASYTTSDKTKLDGIATGAEVNQNAFSNVVVGSTTISADSKTDSLTLAGSNVTLTPDATNDKVTIGITKANVTSALGYTPPTTNTTYGVATSSSLGLVKSGTDITVDSSGNVSVNDDSHNHTISNVDGLQTALDGKASSSHTHSSYVNQNAFSNVTVGSTTIAADTTTDTLTLVAGSNVTITPDATNDKITISSTDTKYTHPTTSGNKHIPSGGSSGQILRWSADGTAVWGADNNTTYGVVSTTADGLAPKRDGSTTKYLRADGTWAVPPDTNTTYTSLKNPYALTIQGNGTTLTNGTYDGSAAKTVNITPASIGAAASSHGTHVSYGTSASALGTSSAGSATTVSRSDHVHALPALTSCSGTLTVAKGGTGATTAAGALTNLGLTATATELNVLDGITATTAELNYCDGVTSNIQTQLNGKANSSHGTHVTYSTTVPVMDGTASVGTATTVARSDHKHPTDTSRASTSSVLSTVAQCEASTTSTDIASAAALAGLSTELGKTTTVNLVLSAKSIANGVKTSIGTFTVQPGVYIIDAFVRWFGNSNGFRSMNINTSSSPSYELSAFPESNIVSASGITYPITQRVNMTFNITTATTYHVLVFQNSGNALNMDYSQVRITKLK